MVDLVTLVVYGCSIYVSLDFFGFCGSSVMHEGISCFKFCCQCTCNTSWSIDTPGMMAALHPAETALRKATTVE